MKKAFLILIIVLFSTSALFAEYNSAAVVAVMRGNLANINAAAAATESGDYFQAAVHFMEVAEGMNSIKHFEPYRGSKADWDANIESVVETSFMAIGACGAEDLGKVNELIGKLWELNKKGHGENK